MVVVVPSTFTMNIILILWLLAMLFGLWICVQTYQAHNNPVRVRLASKQKYGAKVKYPTRKEEYHQEFARFKKRKKAPRRQIARIPKKSKHWKEIMELVRHDEKTAKRLVQYAKDCNPGRSDNWAVEKALWDLQRDRK